MPAYRNVDLYADVVQVQHEAPDLFGSGRVVARNLILTCRHVVTVEGDTKPVKRKWTVRREITRPENGPDWEWDDAEVIWHGTGGLDLALLAVKPKARAGDWLPKLILRVARADRMIEYAVRALGYPLGANIAGKRVLMAPGGGLLDEHRPTVTFKVDPGSKPDVPDADWPGFSGASVFLAVSEDPTVVWIFGAAQQVPSNFSGQLDVARLESALQDPQFRQLLERAGAKDLSAADPVETAEMDRALRPIRDVVRQMQALSRLEDARELKKNLVIRLSILNEWLTKHKGEANLFDLSSLDRLQNCCEKALATLWPLHPKDLLISPKRHKPELQESIEDISKILKGALPLYIAVLDGPAPEVWELFSGLRLLDLKGRLESFVEPSRDPKHYMGAVTRYLLDDVDAIADEDTPAIVGALIDGSNLSLKDRITQRSQQLTNLALIISRQPQAYCKTTGFRLWIIKNGDDSAAIDFRTIKTLKNALVPPLQWSEIREEEIDSEYGLVHVAKQFARDAANRLPVIEANAKGHLKVSVP